MEHDECLKRIIKMGSAIKSVRIYCEEMAQYTQDLEKQIELLKLEIKEE